MSEKERKNLACIQYTVRGNCLGRRYNGGEPKKSIGLCQGVCRMIQTNNDDGNDDGMMKAVIVIMVMTMIMRK